MFDVRGVTRRFPASPVPVWALRDVDIAVPTGRITALLGPSGSGKTTLLRILAGFERPDEGEVRLGDIVVAGPGVFVPPERRNVGIVTQDGSLFPHLDVAANIAYGLDGQWRRHWSSATRRARTERVAELLDLVGLSGHERRRPDELSGGQQQRVALARALAPSPSVILLDEPFSALDASLRVELREEVCGVLRTLGTTAVLVTHDQGEALSLADHVVILSDGRVVQSGEPAALYANPSDAPTAALLGEVVLLPATVASTSSNGVPPCAECALGPVTIDATTSVDDEGRCLVVLRPEQLWLDHQGVPATVTATSYYGHDGIVRLLVEGVDEPVTVRTVGRLPAVGCRVEVGVIPETVAHAVSVPVERIIAPLS